MLGPEARVLMVAAGDDRVGPLSEGLDALGWRTVTARTLAAAERAAGDLNAEAAVFDLADPMAPGALERLRAAAHPRTLAMVGLGETDAPGFDLVMSGPVHPAQLALRLDQLVRAAVAEEEFVVRSATFAAHDAVLEAPDASG